MTLWRKHPDLCVIGMLLVGFLTYQHGAEALAAAGPHFRAITSAVSTQLAEFVSSGSETSDPGVGAEVDGRVPSVLLPTKGESQRIGRLPICVEIEGHNCARQANLRKSPLRRARRDVPACI